MFRLWIGEKMDIVVTALLMGGLFLATPPDTVRSFQIELPGQRNNAIQTSWPGIGCWFWSAEEFEPEGYERFIDLHRDHSTFKLLTTSIRHPVEVTDPAVHDQIKRAAEYAESQGLSMVMDLDVRLARQAFQAAHPDELQEIVCLREIGLDEAGAGTLSVPSVELGDHYTFQAPSYHTVSSRVLRVYAYQRGPEGIDPETVCDVTDRCRIDRADVQGLSVTIHCGSGQAGQTACVMAAFALFTPDVFAPHLTEFERGILKQYSDVPLAGACKDEWGFPGRFKIQTDDLWFSEAMADAYARRRPGHDLVRDLLLMAKGERGREGDRIAAINHTMEMSWQRNSEVENLFYRSVKKVFGPEAMMATHPTWFPFPGQMEAFKNGLDWWACKRDLAQTDETTPFACRTALAKKWQSPLWVNMYYSSSRASYDQEIWRSVLGGGRVNFHPVYPGPAEQRTTSLLSGDLLRAECRIRLLNCISTAPVDCPVAVVFGHPASLNWAGPSPWDVGVEITNGLWKEGYYADLIPTSEIQSGALFMARDGRVQYGPQRYEVVVLYHPQFERPETAEFFRKAGSLGKTTLMRVGDWSVDFEGNPYDGNTALPPNMASVEGTVCSANVVAHLRAAGVAPQTRSILSGGPGFSESMMPGLRGQCRLIDGTIILASGEKEVMGDPIQETLVVQGHEVSFDAIGVAAVRLDAQGHVEAVAAGGLKRFLAPDISLELSARVDIALWRDKKGEWVGVIQGHDGPIPEPLERMTSRWTRGRWPIPYEP